MGDHPIHLAAGIGLRLSRMPKRASTDGVGRWLTAQSLRQGDRRPMTLLWFAIWLVFNLVVTASRSRSIPSTGGRER
jgi:hypothetical protein